MKKLLTTVVIFATQSMSSIAELEVNSEYEVASIFDFGDAPAKITLVRNQDGRRVNTSEGSLVEGIEILSVQCIGGRDYVVGERDGETLFFALKSFESNTHIRHAQKLSKYSAEVTTRTTHIKREGGFLEVDPTRITGVVWSDATHIDVEQTQEIPLTLNHGFDVTFELSDDFPEVDSVQLRVTHPEMKDGADIFPGVIDREEPLWNNIEGRSVSFTYCFDESWELVQGTWTVTIYHEDLVLGSSEVNTYHR